MKRGTLRAFLLYMIYVLATVLPVRAQWIPLNPVAGIQQQSDGVRIALKTGYLHLRVCTDSIVRVQYSLEGDFPARADFIITKTNWPHADFSLTQNPTSVTLKTARLTVKVNRANSAISFLDEKENKFWGRPSTPPPARKSSPRKNPAG